MPRDIELILDDILGMIEFIEETVARKSREQVMVDRRSELALQRAMEIISEASRHIPDDLRRHMPDIPWQSIRAIGNILRHEYHRIADDIIWDSVVGDLPGLKVAMLVLRAKTTSV